VAGKRTDLATDFRDLLCALVDHGVRFLVVGAYALAAHGRPRGTGDLDIWVEPTLENAPRVLAALAAFGAPLRDLTVEDLATPGVVFQIGLPPVRIDILTKIDAVEFAAAWPNRLAARFGKIPVSIIGRDDFLTNKRAVGRLKDLADAERLDPGKRSRGTAARSKARGRPRRSR